MFLETGKTIESNLKYQGFKFDSIRLHFFSRRATIRRGHRKTVCHLSRTTGMNFPHRYVTWGLCQKTKRNGRTVLVHIGIGDLNDRLNAAS